MTPRAKGLAVLAVQLLLVLSIAAKYAWERHTLPRVWTRMAQVDPDLPLRGRYLALSLTADACGLSLDKATPQYEWKDGEKSQHVRSWEWQVVTIERNGFLTAEMHGPDHPEDSMRLVLGNGRPCEHATLQSDTEFYLSEHAKSPFPLKKGEELWAEVTVPPTGPPRPIRLAISDGKSFRILALR